MYIEVCPLLDIPLFLYLYKYMVIFNADNYKTSISTHEKPYQLYR